ncbi:hypothetical protein [Methanosarcina siciliae]|nr:hypothetical protein [Methanosarcina siciliae]
MTPSKKNLAYYLQEPFRSLVDLELSAWLKVGLWTVKTLSGQKITISG